MGTQRKRPRRVCIAPVDIASYYSGLRQGLVEQGIPCWFFCFDASSYSRYQPSAEAFWLERWIFAVAKSPLLARSAPGRAIRELILAALRGVALILALFACDLFIFGFSKTFFRGLELPLLHWFGRTVICVFNGSDTRAPWMSGIFTLGPGTPNPAIIRKEIIRQQRRIRRLERWTSATVCHPLSAHLLHRPFFNHLQIGVPCAAPFLQPTAAGQGEPLRIVHAPTRPLQKGSPVFRAIIDRLRAEGTAIEYIELTGRPNHEVLATIASCDLVLDESYSDTPLAGLGTEAACAGRPAVVGGYGADTIVAFAAGTDLRMELFVHPNALETTVRKLVHDANARRTLGLAAQTFLRTQWAPSAVAARFIAIAAGAAPANWRVEPSSLTYWQGWGAPELATRTAIAALIERYGIESLGISHNRPLEKQLASLVESTTTLPHAATTLH